MKGPVTAVLDPGNCRFGPRSRRCWTEVTAVLGPVMAVMDLVTAVMDQVTAVFGPATAVMDNVTAVIDQVTAVFGPVTAVIDQIMAVMTGSRL